MMDTASSIMTGQSAMFLAQQQPLNKPGAAIDPGKAGAAAKEYESVFISQFLGSMFSGIKTDENTGGGQGEEMFRSLMVNEYAKSLTARGGFGLATHMQAELLKHQQAPLTPNSGSQTAAPQISVVPAPARPIPVPKVIQ
jgi:flagellar protein FlgJ